MSAPYARSSRRRGPVGIRSRTLHLSHQTVAIETATGEIVGSAHVWNEGDKYSNIGVLVTAKEHSTQALKRRLLREAIINANATDRWLVYAAKPDCLPLLLSEGFQRIVEIHRQQGIFEIAPQPPSIAGYVREAKKTEHEEIYALDRTVTPGRDRTDVLRAGVKSGGRLLVHRASKTGPIDGFAFAARGSGNAIMVRPIVAASESIAANLLAAAVKPGDVCSTASFSTASFTRNGPIKKMCIEAGLNWMQSSILVHKNGPEHFTSFNNNVREYVPTL